MEALKSMYWDRLKKMQCPKCNKLIKDNINIQMYECSNLKCTFKISHDIFNKVVTDLYQKSTKPDSIFVKNLSELNNL